MHAHLASSRRRALVAGLALQLAAAAGCGAAQGGTAGSPTLHGTTPTGTGNLSVALTDAPPASQVTAIQVQVVRVIAHAVPGGWVTLSTTPTAFDLLQLQAHAADLGVTALPPGTVTEVRLVLAETGNTVTVGGQTLPLKVPSGAQSGVKIKGPWQISACSETAVTLDFDGAHSIQTHPAQGGAEWILRPVIRVKRSDTSTVGCTGDSTGATGGTGGTPTVPPTPTGDPCSYAFECHTGVCSNSVCAPGGPGTPCTSPGDCTTATCDEATGVCGGTAGTPGTTCTVATDCNSGTCDGTCALGGQGTPCTADDQCESGLACTSGFCAPARAL